MLLIAAVTGILISLSMPLTYFALHLTEQREAISASSQDLALRIQKAVRENPDLWQFSVAKLAHTS